VLEYTLLNQVKITINAPSSVTNLADWRIDTQIQSLATNGESRAQKQVFSMGVGTITTQTYLVTDSTTKQVFLATSMSDAKGNKFETSMKPITPAAIDFYTSIDRVSISVQGKDPSASLDGWEIVAEANNFITNGENLSQAVALSNGVGTLDTQTYLVTDGKTANAATAFAFTNTSDVSAVGVRTISRIQATDLNIEGRSLSGILPDRLLNPIFAADRPKDKQVVGTDNNDGIFGSDRRDILTGNSGNDILNGYDGNDLLQGGAGNDILNGGRGDDKLDAYGGSGDRDLLFGGAGEDRFILGKDRQSYYTGDGYATIADFDPSAGDRLKLAGKWKDYTFTLGNSTGEFTTATSQDLVIRLASNGDAIAVLQNVGSIDRHLVGFG
jgi:Ca2+-binding RTX toxin-like protein